MQSAKTLNANSQISIITLPSLDKCFKGFGNAVRLPRTQSCCDFYFFFKVKTFLHVRSHRVQKKRHAIAEDKFDFSKEGGPLSLTSYVTGI